MTKGQIVRYEMLRRVRDFGVAHQAQFLAASVGGQAFATVGAVLDDLIAQATLTMATAQEGFRAKKQARQVLAKQLDEIARTAKVIARTTQRFDDGFRLPRRRNDQLLVTAGRLFVDGAQPVAAQFTAHGLPESFIPTLQASLQQFEEAIAACEDGSREQASAQAQIKAKLATGRDAVTCLDVIIANQFKDDVATVAQWRRDRHQRAAYRREPPEPVTSPTAPKPGGQDGIDASKVRLMAAPAQGFAPEEQG
jgi:hypothetical protein